MKFLIDAQLPRRLAEWLKSAGHEAIHTRDLPQANRTPDSVVSDEADRDGRAVVTKDSDFVNSHLLQNRPQRLLLISTGNISNNDLQSLLVPLIPDIECEFASASFLELGTSGLIVRG